MTTQSTHSHASKNSLKTTNKKGKKMDNNEPQTQLETATIQGDVLQQGLSKINNQEHRDLIQWLFLNYSIHC